MESTRVLRELTGSCDGMMPESERHCVGQTMPLEPGVHAGRAKEGRPSLASLPRKEERQVRLITVPGGAGNRARGLGQGAGGAGSPEAGPGLVAGEAERQGQGGEGGAGGRGCGRGIERPAAMGMRGGVKAPLRL